MVKVAFVLSAIDPLHGAGFTLDLQVLQNFGVKAVGVPTGILPQDPSGVKGSIFFPEKWLEESFNPIKNLRFSGLKVSILGNSLGILKDVLERVEGPKVLDPILWAGGMKVSSVSVIREIASEFDLITPNIPEAKEILGKELSPVDLCLTLQKEFSTSVLLKGGHSEGKVDYLCFEGRVLSFVPRAIFPYEVHGTGCLLSSAILGLLMKGKGLKKAVAEAKEFLEEKYRTAVTLGSGKRVFL